MSFIVVQHYQFSIQDPFEEGHVMTATEANVLNWHRARLIQKIVRAWVLDAVNNSPNEILSHEEVNAIASRVEEFDRTYQLSPAKEPKISSLEFNLELLAQNFLLRNSNDPTELLRREDIERIKKTPEIQEKARDLIKSSTFSLDELMV